MKNILARGGIEFLAVFLGIGLSFYVEQWQSDNEQKDLLVKDCQNILTDVDEDIFTINKIIDSNNIILKACDNIQSIITSDEVLVVDSIILDLYKLTYPTFFGITRSYKLSYSTGRLNLYANEKLVKEISKLEADERVVFLLSDANLEAYGIGGKDLDKLIKTGQDLDVRVFVMFIGTLGDQAVRLVKESGSGRAGRIMIAMRTEDIPKLVKRCLMMVV